MNFKEFVDKGQTQVQAHKSDILFGMGLGFMFVAIGKAINDGPKAVQLLEERKTEENTDELTRAEVIQTTWQCYIPTAIATMLSIACFAESKSITAKRNAALATACTLSETALKEYIEKTKEVIGEKKEQEVRDAIAKDHVERHPISSSEVFLSNTGDTLCYDGITCRYFMSDKVTLEALANELTSRVRKEGCVLLNDYFYEINLKSSSIGDLLGWEGEDSEIKFIFSSQITDDGRPCLVVDFEYPPQYVTDYYYR